MHNEQPTGLFTRSIDYAAGVNSVSYGDVAAVLFATLKTAGDFNRKMMGIG